MTRSVDLSSARADFFSFNAFRLTEYALMVVASHTPQQVDPPVCGVCGKRWLCPLTRWAADWILTARRLGLMEVLGPLLDDDPDADSDNPDE
jgi:hypothetical protein